MISGWYLVEGQEGAENDFDIDFIKTAPIEDVTIITTTTTTTTSTNGIFGFSALMILVIYSGFGLLRRRR